jgi:hypothetical protein
MVNLYAAMPSLHVAWAVWCAVAVATATHTRWRHLAWLYPVATTFVVLASANHFVLDAAGGAAITALGLLATRRTTARSHAPVQPTRRASVPDAADLAPSPGPSGAVLASALSRQTAPGAHHAMAAQTPDGRPRPQPRSRSP